MSNFTSATPGSADWVEGSRTCRSTGRGVLSDLRAGLIWESRGRMDADTESAAVQQEVDAAGTSGWSVAVLGSLASLLTQYGLSAYAQAARADAARPGAPISPATMQGALWAAYGLGSRTTSSVGKDGTSSTQNIHTGSPAQYTISAGTVLPSVGSIPPVPTDQITTGRSCAPTGASANQPGLTAVGVRTIDPLLLFLLIGAGALAGWAVMEAARGKQGSAW